ncbi:MAG: hypothetical protein JWN17_2238, partial [Frankiales bacterium]|nr:hypothetical protein [Frankiales bacterium]
FRQGFGRSVDVRGTGGHREHVPRQRRKPQTRTAGPAPQGSVAAKKAVPVTSAAGNAATAKAQAPAKAVAPAAPAAPTQAAPVAVFRNAGERSGWWQAHAAEINALSRAKRNQLDRLPYPVTSTQLDDELAQLKAPAAVTLSSSLTRSSWARLAGLGATSRSASTLGMDSVGTYGGKNVHLTLFKDEDQSLDVSLGFKELLKRVVRQDTRPPMHVTVELHPNKDDPKNPRAFGTASGQTWANRVDAQAAAALGEKDQPKKVEDDLRAMAKAQVELVSQALRPPFTARGGTKD